VTLLRLEEVTAHHGHLCALHPLTIEIDAGETVAVIGANGAGKSTLMSVIAGELSPSAGRILVDDVDVTKLDTHRRVQLGIALVPEGRRLFGTLTVEENLLVGAAVRTKGYWNLDSVYDLFPLLISLRRRRAQLLSGGEQQAVAIGRALMSNPRLLLLDEVSLGLAPVVVQRLYQALPVISAEGTTLLLVEQDLSQALEIVDRLLCLLEGRVVLEGPAATFDRQAIANAYFGHHVASALGNAASTGP
jgi:branched-chain amino acid transport system ATP-binding protein